MSDKKKYAVTGAFGYSGKYITHKLLSLGHEVITLTGSPDRPNPFKGEVKAYSFNFDDPEALIESLQGVEVLFNTYWVRFSHGENTHQQAISNTRKLFRAAKAAGVRRIVHTSITNPSTDLHLPYFWGKKILEEDLQASGLSYAILRPTVIFGKEDILINNIAWFLGHFPVFAIPGNGSYKLQPIYVEDMAELAVRASQSIENQIIDAIGPETYTFIELVKMIKSKKKSKCLLINTPPKFAYWASSIVGKLVGDVVLTADEVDGLMANLLVTDSPPAGETKLSEWVEANTQTLGKKYANEIKRHFKVR